MKATRGLLGFFMALAFVGVFAQAIAAEAAPVNNDAPALFEVSEVGSSLLIAEGHGGDHECGEGSCSHEGEHSCGDKEGGEHSCGEGSCG